MKQFIKLQTESILQIPLNQYEKNFTFIVNGKSYYTSKFIADLLSPKISNIHRIDPTVDEFVIKTHINGDFEQFLSLNNFKEEYLSEKELHFFLEIIEKLETEKIDVKIDSSPISINNVIDRLQVHSISRQFYSKEYKEEITFVAKNFHRILEKQEDNLYDLSVLTFEDIFNDESFQIETEDELLEFINSLYSKSSDFSTLYEKVCFSNVSVEGIENFLSIFKINDLSQGAWLSLSKRLRCQIVKNESENIQTNLIQKNNYSNNSIEQTYSIQNDTNHNTNEKTNENQPNDSVIKIEQSDSIPKNEQNLTTLIEIPFKNVDFDGIFNFFQKNSDIDDEVKITFSSFNYGQPENLIQFNNQDFFGTGNQSNSWICFEFTKHNVIPTCYTIKSCDYGANWLHPKSWVIEGSDDSNIWEKIDEQNDCSLLKGASIVHTFQIMNEKSHEFKFIRIRQTDRNWKNNNCLYINCIEFYGLLK